MNCFNMADERRLVLFYNLNNSDKISIENLLQNKIFKLSF